MLQKGFGEVRKNFNLCLSARLEDYKSHIHYDSLRRIYKSLQEIRGHYDFVRAKSLSAADFFLVNQRSILEFDESQHFTAPRKLSLQLYPPDLKVGFSRERWISLCEELDKHDDSPKYRDEQRAWYDVLKDFAASATNTPPTIRLYAKDYRWCDLRPDNNESLKVFKKAISGA